MLNYIMTQYKNIFFPDHIFSQISSEERRKRIYGAAVASIAIPIFLIFGLIYLLEPGGKNGLLELCMAFFLIIVIGYLRNSLVSRVPYRTVMGVYRVAMGGISCYLLFNMINYLYDGVFFWLYLYTLIVFYFFGTKEGAMWVIMTLVPAFIIIYFPRLEGSSDYTDTFKIRFVISMIVMFFISGFLESLRVSFYEKIQKKNNDLEEALNNVKTLSGLIPICGSCKKIRNDKGYWQAVEQYIAQKTDVQFSHGICADCLKKAHPEIYHNMVDKDKKSKGNSDKIN